LLTNSSDILDNYNFIKNLDDVLEIKFDSEKIIPTASCCFINEENFFELYLPLRKSSFINFFTTNMVDVPICFKKSKSIKTKNFEFFFLKFNNLLMRDGKREKTLRLFLNSFFNFFETFLEKKLETENNRLN
jgi:hypothetical protein